MKQDFGKKNSVTPNTDTILKSNLPNFSKTSLKIGEKTDEHTMLSKLQHSQLIDDEETNSDEDIKPKRKKKIPRCIIRGDKGGLEIQR